MSKLVLVTGATGNVGSRIVQLLVERGQPVRALVRRESTTLPAAAERVRGDLGDPRSLRAALDGVTAVYAVTSGPELTQHDANLIAAAADAGVAHIVKHSVGGAEFERGRIATWHRAGEKLLERSKLAWTHVRPSSFASNAFGWIGSIAAQGKVYGPAGDTAMPVIDPEDIAEVGATVLANPTPHAGKAYVITGPQALTNPEQVQILAGLFGRSLDYVAIPDAAIRKAMVDMGMAADWADGLVEMMVALRSRARIDPTDDVERVLGRKPHTFAEWAQRNRGAFEAPRG